MKVIVRIEKMEGWSEKVVSIPKNRANEFVVLYAPSEDFLLVEFLDLKTRKTLACYDKEEGLC